MQQTWVQLDNLSQRSVGHIRHQPQIDRVIDAHGVGDHRQVGDESFQTILLWILRHDDRGDDAGHIVLGRRWQRIPLVQLPKISVSRSHHRALHIPRSPVVCSHREVPVAELLVQEFHVPGVGERRLLRIEALVDPSVSRQPVGTLEGHELPHPARAAMRVDRLRLKSRLRHGKIDQVLRDTRIGEVALDHFLVLAGARQRVHQGGVALLRVRKVVDESGDIIVHHQGKVRLRRLQLRRNLRLQLRVGRKSHLIGRIERRGFDGL